MLEESDLASLLNDDKVLSVTCNSWIEVGLQLGLPISKLKKIEQDNHYSRDACKREMLLLWLRNGDNPTQEKLYAAIDVVNAREAREQHRTQARNDGERAKKGIDDVMSVIETWETKDKQLEIDSKDLESNVTKQEEQMHDYVMQGEEERNEWQNGEIARRREKIGRSLHQANFTDDPFVTEFLENEGLQNISTQEIEALLRNALANIYINRSRKLAMQYRQIRIHLNQLESLQTELKLSQRVTKERLDTYQHIIERLRKLGMKAANLKQIEDWYERLKSAKQRCDITEKRCSEIFTDRKNLVENWKSDLEAFIKSFDQNIEGMSARLPELEKLIETLLTASAATVGGVVGTVTGGVLGGAMGGTAGGIIGGIISGAVTGAATGSIAPGPGTLLGLLVGGLGGMIIAGAGMGHDGMVAGAAAGNALARSITTPPPTPQQRIRNYKETLERAKNEQQKLKELLQI